MPLGPRLQPDQPSGGRGGEPGQPGQSAGDRQRDKNCEEEREMRRDFFLRQFFRATSSAEMGRGEIGIRRAALDRVSVGSYQLAVAHAFMHSFPCEALLSDVRNVLTSAEVLG